jgi:hypothetical protein
MKIGPALARLRVRASLSVEILATFVSVRLTMREPDIRRTLERLREGGDAPATASDLQAAFYLAHAVNRVLAPIPRGSRCLVQSLVLTKMLARRGISSSLVIAVAPGPQLEAHAWVESGHVPLLRPATPEQAQLVRL